MICRIENKRKRKKRHKENKYGKHWKRRWKLLACGYERKEEEEEEEEKKKEEKVIARFGRLKYPAAPHLLILLPRGLSRPSLRGQGRLGSEGRKGGINVD